MTTEGHIAALERRHNELDLQLEKELQHTSYDDMLILKIKRRKLEVKDELVKLQSRAA